MVAIQFYLCWVHIISKYILEIIAPRKAALSKWLALTCMPNLTFFRAVPLIRVYLCFFFFPLSFQVRVENDRTVLFSYPRCPGDTYFKANSCQFCEMFPAHFLESAMILFSWHLFEVRETLVQVSLAESLLV